MRIIRVDDQSFIPASHENPDNPGVFKRVLATKDELLNGRVQMVNWARLPVGSAFQAHYHEDMEEIFIIVSGTIQMQVGSETHDLVAGDTIIISPREVHKMQNTCTRDVDYIVVGISLGKGGQTVVV